MRFESRGANTPTIIKRLSTQGSKSPTVGTGHSIISGYCLDLTGDSLPELQPSKRVEGQSCTEIAGTLARALALRQFRVGQSNVWDPPALPTGYRDIPGI